MPELDFLTSTSKTGVSVVSVNIDERYSEMQPIWDKLRRKVDRAVPDLPDSIVGPIVDDEFGDVFGMIMSITGEDFDYRYLKDVADEVRQSVMIYAPARWICAPCHNIQPVSPTENIVAMYQTIHELGGL